METKYNAIAQWARGEIIGGGFEPGDRFYPEGRICEIHGVSRQTVRQALDLLEREGLLERRRGSGTYVRRLRPAAGVQGHNVGVVSTYFGDYIFPGIITGIEKRLSRHHYGMQLAITHNRVQDEAKALRGMLEQNISALIVEPTKSALPSPNRAMYRDIQNRGIPLVFFNARYPWAGFPLLALDDIEAGRMATRCLADAGHTRIAAIFQSDDIQGHLRYQGYLQCLEEAGLPVESQRVLWYATEDINNLFALPQHLLQRLGKSTGVVCYNDDIALRLLGFCKEQGISVPGGLSIIGIDGSAPGTLCEPPLTTIEHPKAQLGAAVADAVLALLEDASAPVGRLFAPQLVLRATVGKPK